jgi:hypothetical protein
MPRAQALRRFSLRFLCAYFALYILPFPVDMALTLAGKEMSWYYRPWAALVRLAGRRVFGLTAPLDLMAPSHVGDRTEDYLLVFCIAAVALVAAGIWSTLDRRRDEDRKVFDWLHVWSRYYLAATMLSYGFDKLLPTQMTIPSPRMLLNPYGHSSPFELLWTFMGYSPAYVIFSGAGEVLGALLLFFRRTTTLGAVILAGILTNVIMLNFCYDVGVKLYSTHLFLLCLFVAAPDARRLAGALLKGYVPPVKPEMSYPARWKKRRIAVKWASIAAIVGITFTDVLQCYYSYGNASWKSRLYGAYDVEELRRNGKAIAPLLTDPDYWQRVAIGNRHLSVFGPDGSVRDYPFSFDSARSVATLTLPSGPGKKKTAELRVSRPSQGRLLLLGKWDGNDVSVRMRPAALKNFALNRNEFRWIVTDPALDPREF